MLTGQVLGPYRILDKIGAGGMGEVYRATDTNLKRQVAIKVLPASVAADPDRLARFQREAEVLAALNHPHIGQIYGLEKSAPSPSSGQAGTIALVMELVEGPTLAERISQGAIPLDEALPIAKQIAEALEAAHEQGIIHRDLKPANIKVRDDGTVKVLDFGLAKAMDPAGASSDHAMNSPTISMHATQAGLILGTAAYMSPEQARGQAVDKRADIWAFGAVLYEMLTGTRAFAGRDTPDVLATVIKIDPEWKALPPETPLAIERLLRRCLTKDHRQRLGDIRDARIEIADAQSAPPDRASAAAPPHAGRGRVAWATGGALLVTAVGALLFDLGIITLRDEPAETPAVRFTIADPDGVTIVGAPAISPDGRRIVFQVSDGYLWMRSLDSLAVQRVPGTGGGTQPFWSPDNRSVGFFAESRLKRVDVAAGAVVTLCEADGIRAGGSWSASGVIVFGAGAGALHQVPVAGGVPAPATILDPSMHDVEHRWPHFLPDGRHFLYSSVRAGGFQGLAVGSLDGTVGTAVESNSIRMRSMRPLVSFFSRGGPR